MFCTTECWDCEDKSCEHYRSKHDLYFENKKLKKTLNKIINETENYATEKYSKTTSYKTFSRYMELVHIIRAIIKEYNEEGK